MYMLPCYINYLTIPSTFCVAVTVSTSFEISTGIVVLAPLSLPSIIKEVNNLVAVPNNVCAFFAVNENDWPIAVSAIAELEKGRRLADVPFWLVAVNLDNSLLSAIVAIYPPGSLRLDWPLKLSVVGLTTVVEPKERVIFAVLAVTTGIAEVPLGKVTNLLFKIA